MSDASGTMTCVHVEVIPTTSSALASSGNDGAAAASPRNTAVATSMPEIRPRRSTRSPSGTSSTIPTA